MKDSGTSLVKPVAMHCNPLQYVACLQQVDVVVKGGLRFR
jgi:hypothetical protein